VAVMGDLSRSAADQRMRDFDRMVGEAGRRVCGQEIVTMSCGYAQFPSDASTAENLLAQAYSRMQKQKQERRDAVRGALEPEEVGITS